jgi:outer membrane protein insertion porin family
MTKFFLKIHLIYFLLISFSFSEIIKNVDVTGNKRLSSDTILILAGIKLNDDLNDDNINTILKSLYKTNFFEKINLELNDGTLFVNVIENPIIENIEFRGVKNKRLISLISDKIYSRNRVSFSKIKAREDLNIIKNILKQNGYYFSEVNISQNLNEELNSTNLFIDINLGNKAKINKIKFIGNKIFKDKNLRSIIVSEEHKFWKFISNNVYLNENQINLDKRLLINQYRNFGYPDVEVFDTFAQLDNDGNFDLIYNINSGEKYFFNDFKLNLPQDYNNKDFSSLDKIFNKITNEEYSLNSIKLILDEIEYIASIRLYDFVDANIEEIKNDNNKIDIIINIVDTEPYFIEKVNFFGNFNTFEEVLRNKLIVDEGDPLNNILLTKSIDNIKSTGFFKSVNYEIQNSTNNDNLKVINVTVEEQPTGEISLGAGFGTDGSSIGGAISEKNFLGKGINLNTNLELSEDSIRGQFIYSRPNFAYTDNTLFTTLKSISSDFMSDYGYKVNNIGASIATEFEQFENLFFKPELDFMIEKLETNSKSTEVLKKQEGTYEDFYFNYGLTYDQRNSKYKPTSGYISNFSQNLPLISDIKEISNSFILTNYNSINKDKDMTLRTSLYLKSVNSIDSNENARISKRAQLPSNRLRGFIKGKVGPVDNSEYVGGNYAASLNISSNLPFILREYDNFDVNYFIDIGNVWGVDYSDAIDDSSKVRSSSGIGVDFLSPIGPLSFSYAIPISKKSTDKTENFRFNLGTNF